MVSTSSAPCDASTSSVVPTATITPSTDGDRPVGDDPELALRRAAAWLAASSTAYERGRMNDVEIAHWQNSRIKLLVHVDRLEVLGFETYSSGKLYGGSPGPKLTPSTPN